MVYESNVNVLVRVDGTCGEVVSIETCETREWHARHGDHGACFANTLYTVLNQLVSLRAGDYLLKHEVSRALSVSLLYCYYKCESLYRNLLLNHTRTPEWIWMGLQSSVR